MPNRSRRTSHALALILDAPTYDSVNASPLTVTSTIIAPTSSIASIVTESSMSPSKCLVDGSPTHYLRKGPSSKRGALSLLQSNHNFVASFPKIPLPHIFWPRPHLTVEISSKWWSPAYAYPRLIFDCLSGYQISNTLASFHVPSTPSLNFDLSCFTHFVLYSLFIS